MPESILLGHLARFGAFSAQSEVLCTQGLTHLLSAHEDARMAFSAEVTSRAGVTVAEDLKWLAESKQADGARPDLEACAADGVPVVKIEAKLGAALLANQLQSYLHDLLARNSGPSALLVLVPRGRTMEAARVTAAALELQGSGPWPCTDDRRCGVAVISWDELFDCLARGESARCRHELEQLQAMYRVLSGDYIAPLASDEDLSTLGERETDFINLVDQATRELTGSQRLLPLRFESLESQVSREQAEEGSEQKGYQLRYVCVSSQMPETCCSMGVRDSFAEWITPVWMRFHKNTGRFGEIRERIERSAVRWLESGGHIWVPLFLPLSEPAEAMVDSLVAQARDVLQVACPDD